MEKEINLLLQQAVENGYLVELRVEDMPNMTVDFIIKTKIKKAILEERIKGLRIEAPNLNLMMNYETLKMGTQSATHNKFYVESQGATITITINM